MRQIHREFSLYNLSTALPVFSAALTSHLAVWLTLLDILHLLRVALSGCSPM